ncbi:activin receptor type-2A-like isoform X6 [Tachypleus tridentatus]|uniref:activin receptor type-2A-like isoform X6 n=1 Tax=Tachypleus tridentatus TaxID=6853 RepID=UPI003FD27A42
MVNILQKYYVCVSCAMIVMAVRATTVSDSMNCEYYNETACKNSRFGFGCNGTEDCKSLSPDKGNQCYVLWQIKPEGFSIKLKGCWVGNKHDCTAGSQCTKTKKDPNINLVFCCCEGDMCNNNMTRMPIISTSEDAVRSSTSVPIPIASGRNPVLNTLLYTLAPLLGTTIVLIAAYWAYRRRKMVYFNEVPTVGPPSLPSPSPLSLKPVQLMEIKAQGKFGAVWKAQMLNEFVAVKIFPFQDKSSWQMEQMIYQLPQMKHNNILDFIAAERRGDGFQLEYWLITAYHERGSLSDFLKVGTRRYMAPEVLEGAISFNRDAFLRIDMYACGLVLWELLSRCCINDDLVGEYTPPYEEEVGQHPTLEDMQEIVVQKKARPKLKTSWKKHPGITSLCNTIEECWDHDSEARLSASCVLERVLLLYKSDFGNESGMKNPSTTSPTLTCSQFV